MQAFNVGLTTHKMPSQWQQQSIKTLFVCLQFHCIGRGASKVVYKGFDEVEGIEVAWNEVSCSDWVLGR